MPKRAGKTKVVKLRKPNGITRPSLTARLLLTHNVRSLLSERGLNQTELARRMGRSQPYISQILNAKRGIAIEALDDLAATLDITVEQLFLDPLRAPVRHVTTDEATLLDAYRTAPADTREAIRLMLHIPRADAPPETAADVRTTQDELVAALADAIETLRHRAPIHGAGAGASAGPARKT